MGLHRYLIVHMGHRVLQIKPYAVEKEPTSLQCQSLKLAVILFLQTWRKGCQKIAENKTTYISTAGLFLSYFTLSV